MQDKSLPLLKISFKVGLYIHRGKTKILKVNPTSKEPVRLDGKALEEMESFTYLGSMVDKHGGTDADVKTRISKARSAFIQLKNVWSSKDISCHTKIFLFNSNAKTVLLYRSGT